MRCPLGHDRIEAHGTRPVWADEDVAGIRWSLVVPADRAMLFFGGCSLVAGAAFLGEAALRSGGVLWLPPALGAAALLLVGLGLLSQSRNRGEFLLTPTELRVRRWRLERLVEDTEVPLSSVEAVKLETHPTGDDGGVAATVVVRHAGGDWTLPAPMGAVSELRWVQSKVEEAVQRARRVPKREDDLGAQAAVQQLRDLSRG